MASYKSATPLEIVAKGGHYNGETGDNKNKCVTKATATSTWLTNHGATYQNTTGLSYSPTNRVLAIGDVNINSGQSTTVYEFTNYDVPRTLFVRRTSRSLHSRQDVLCSTRQPGDFSPIITSEGSAPIVQIGTEYIAGFDAAIQDSESGILYFLQQQGYNTQYAIFIYPLGTAPYGSDNYQLVNGESLFSLGTHIVLDFQGQNCRNKYFNFIVGRNENDVLLYARGDTIPDHPGESYGWAESTKIGQTSRSYINNAEVLHWINNSGHVDQFFDIPGYQSINTVWVTYAGFGVVFKDTDAINDDATEVFVVGRNLDDNTWNTSSDGFIIECRNFTMS